MLSNHDVMATVAVKDLAVARKFYGEVLGLEAAGADDEMVATFRSGNANLVVYPSDFAGTNQANAATWGVGRDFDGIVQRLKQAGVRLEHYDFPGVEHDGDVHIFGDFKGIWFKDPDGNILHVNNA